LLLELAQEFQGALTATLSLWFGQTRDGGGSGWVGRRRSESHATNLEVFLEAVGLEQVGEFEGADIAALRADLALQVSHHGAQVRQGVTQA